MPLSSAFPTFKELTRKFLDKALSLNSSAKITCRCLHLREEDIQSIGRTQCSAPVTVSLLPGHLVHSLLCSFISDILFNFATGPFFS